MPVMSVRLSDKEIKQIKALAKEEDKEKSSEARQLIVDGIKFKMLVAYKEGRLSLGGLSKRLGFSLSEVIDFLSWLGIPSPVRYDDYLQGYETAKKIFHR